MDVLEDFMPGMIPLLFLGLLALFIATLFVLLIYSGIFAQVDVKTGKPPIGKVLIAYKDGKGPYSNTGSFFCEACSIGPDKKSIGIYYDNPETVPAERLRWAVGSILAEGDEKVDPVLKAAYEKEKYKFMELPDVPLSVNCVFPHTTMISILIGIYRVYPALKNYVVRQGLKPHPYLEIYYDGKIHFMGPLSDQNDFYSPGSLADAENTEAQEEDTKSPETDKDSTSPPSPVSETTKPELTTPVQVDEEDSNEESSDDSYEKVDVNDPGE